MYSHTIIIGEITDIPVERGAAVTLRVKTWRENEQGERRENVHNVEVFKLYREFALQLRPGDMVLAEGCVETSRYKNRRGVWQNWTSLKTIRVQRFAGAGLDRGGVGAGPPTRKSQAVAGSVVEPSTVVVPEEAVQRRTGRYSPNKKPTTRLRKAPPNSTMRVPWNDHE